MTSPSRVELYIFWFLHQTTTRYSLLLNFSCCISFDSYIKPQRLGLQADNIKGCISFDSYIKPQHLVDKTFTMACCISFDSYIKPQQNGFGGYSSSSCISFDSYIKPQLVLYLYGYLLVVYLLIPTSNHNIDVQRLGCLPLYIFWFLHQTTTAVISWS